jgi:hypothetical protein
MDFTERNKKVAEARWKKELSEKKKEILDNNESLFLKSVICGFLAGDGSVQIRKEKTFFHYQIDFFPDDHLMLKTYQDAIFKIYNKTCSVRRRDNVFAVRLTSRIITEDILKYARFGVKEWTLPHKLFSVKGAKEAWLKAFFSAEAYVTDKIIRIQTINKEGMKEVSCQLESIGIQNNYYEYSPKNKNHSGVSIVIITKKAARKRFYDTIGFWHSKKTEALKKALDL